MSRLPCSLCAILLLLSSSTSAAAADEARAAADEAVRVAVSEFPPFVFLEGAPRGYSIALWERVAEQIGVRTEYVPTSGVGAKLDLVRRGEVDLAIGGITVTGDREALVDFSHPTLQAGLSILVRQDEPASAWPRLRAALSKTRLSIFAAFLLLIVIAGHLMWLAERGRESFSDRYVPGVLEGMYWAIVTASTVGYGDKAPVRWRGRLLAGLVIVVSLPLFALFTAELASAMTVEAVQSRIRSPSDLHGKAVGVVRGTQSAAWASRRGLSIAQHGSAEDAFRALAQGEVHAVVHDAPRLLHWAQNEGRGEVLVVGEPFEERSLGLALPEGSPLRERVNRALLRLDESGELDRIRAEWFG